MQLKLVFYFLCIAISIQQQSSAQSPILLKGKVVDAANTKIGLPNVMVVNAASQQGIFTNADGTFTVGIKQTDTIIIRAFGYHLRKICFADSFPQSSYSFSVMLFTETFQLKEVTVFQTRPNDSVMKDLQHLGYDKNDFMIRSSQAFQSPITALYQQFSKKERSKREVAELINIDKRKTLLHELLFFYYRNSVINLKPDEFDRFIDYSNFSDELLKSLSAYELAVYLKNKIAIYTARR